MNLKSHTLLFTASLFLLAACSVKTTENQTIPLNEFEDKLKAAWIGQMVGVGWAAPTEFKWIGDIIPEDKIPEWTTETINQFGQDDMYVEMTFVETLEKYGIDASIRQAGIDFANTQYGLAVANDLSRESLRRGIAPPASGHPRFSSCSEAIDYQIEADFSGIIAPGMPQVPIELGEKFGLIMNYGDGMYAGQFVGAMYSAAYFETDMRKVVEMGLAAIPDSSLYAICMREVIAWHDENPTDWKIAWRKIVDKYYNTLDHQPFHKITPEAWVGIDAKLNGAFIVLGLLYGNGDIETTFYVSACSGFDSDCNPSNALGILFTSKGLSNIPEKYYSGLDNTKKFSYTNYTFPELIEVSKKLALQYLSKYGGKVENGSDQQPYLTIPKVAPMPSKLERAWEPCPLDEATIYFTADEMKNINFLPSSAFKEILSVFAPGWLINGATTEATPELISLYGHDNVLQMAFFKKGGCTIRHELIVPDTKNPKLIVSVANDPDKSWKMDIRFNWKSVYSVNVNDNLTKKGWHDVVYDLSEYRGKKLFISIQGSEADGNNSKVYLSNLNIK